MADPTWAWPDNAGGSVVLRGRGWSFYVDQECILCTVCSEAAPANFRLSADEDHDVCFRQPGSEAELDACLDARNNCPVDAIGADGLGISDRLSLPAAHDSTGR
ncbi:MAG: ferredoxin [Myxococcota bacterium]